MDDEHFIKIDKEFAEAKFCSIHELHIILKDKAAKLSRTKLENSQAEQTLSKCIRYVERFNKFGSSEGQQAVSKAVNLRQKLEKINDLKEFEMSQLINLSPHSKEEALCLIPSLKYKISDEDLDHILTEISNNTILF